MLENIINIKKPTSDFRSKAVVVTPYISTMTTPMGVVHHI